MDQHDDFDNVSWRHDPQSDNSRPTTAGTDDVNDLAGIRSEHDANGKRRMSSAVSPSSKAQRDDETESGPLTGAFDLASIGDGVLECSVDSPLKENDGTKDAYISYLVTTHVSRVRFHFPLNLSRIRFP